MRLVENAPIRAAAMQQYRKAETELGKIRARLNDFEAKDLVAYQQWEAVHLGPLLTELRGLLLETQKIAATMVAIEDECLWTGCSRVAAYRRIIKRQTEGESSDARHNAPDEDGDDFSGGGDFGPDEPEGALPEGMTAETFDAMSRREQKAYREFFEAMAELEEIMTGLPKRDLDELLAQERARNGQPGPEPKAAAPRPAETRTVDRLKELYRILVRQLHPDVNGEQTAQEREFWHQVQDAYQTGNLERLEALHGRVEVGLVGDGNQLPVQVLRRMTEDLREALKGLQRQWNEAMKHPAWKLQRAKNPEKLALRRQQELQADLRKSRAELDYLNRELDALKQKAERPAQKRNAKKAAREKASAPRAHFRQADFPF